jgi:very-short-patch-repair endonuclease
MNKCIKCGLIMKNKNGQANHTRQCKLSSEIVENIKVDYIKNELSIRDLEKKYNISNTIIKKILKGYLRSFRESSKLAHIKYPERFKHSDESKAKLREIRLKWMKENPEKTAWRQSNMSYPEKLFKSKVEELELDKKYLIIRERSFFPYFIDFAFENEKVAIEIDGKQHELPERMESDQEKDNLLIKDGWRVYRIEAKQILERLDEVMIEVIRFIGYSKTFEKCGLITYREYKSDEKKKLKEQRERNGGLTDKEFKDKLKQRKVERPSFDVLLKEIEELGYVGTGRKYGVSDSAIRKWIKWYKKYGA